jgi:cobalt-zinc-cadmium efflux system protein
VAFVGIAINLGTALMFMSGRKGDLNIRGAFVHMAADAAISAGVVVAGVVIAFTHWLWLDPVMSLILAATIIYGTWDLLRESINLSLDAVPENIDPAKVREYLEKLPKVTGAHHLHIWGLSTTEAALTVHLVLTEHADSNTLLREINLTLRKRFQIGHATIQFESPGAHGCENGDCP